MHSSSFCLSSTWSIGVPFKRTSIFLINTYLSSDSISSKLELVSAGGAEGWGNEDSLLVEILSLSRNDRKRLCASSLIWSPMSVSSETFFVEFLPLPLPFWEILIDSWKSWNFCSISCNRFSSSLSLSVEV